MKVLLSVSEVPRPRSSLYTRMRSLRGRWINWNRVLEVTKSDIERRVGEFLHMLRID